MSYYPSQVSYSGHAQQPSYGQPVMYSTSGYTQGYPANGAVYVPLSRSYSISGDHYRHRGDYDNWDDPYIPRRSHSTHSHRRRSRRHSSRPRSEQCSYVSYAYSGVPMSQAPVMVVRLFLQISSRPPRQIQGAHGLRLTTIRSLS